MSTEQEKAAWVLDKMRQAAKVWAQSTDEPSLDLVELLGAYYFESQLVIRDLAFALLADRYPMAEVLRVAPHRTKTVTLLREAVTRLAHGRRRTQFFSVRLDLVWQSPEERGAFVNDDAERIAPAELDLLSEAYRRAIAVDPSFSLTPADLVIMGRCKKAPLLEGVDLTRLGTLVRTCGAFLREHGLNTGLAGEFYLPFGRRRGEIAVGLL